MLVKEEEKDALEEATEALKQMLGMASSSQEVASVKAFEEAFERQKAAEAKNYDPTIIYPFVRRQETV